MGAPVRTPSGRPAVVVAINEERREATVLRLDDGERVSFRWSLLVRPGSPT
jgi:hypothetical protein